MKSILAITVLIFSVFYSFSQPSLKENTVFFEGGGNGLFSSVNYERLISKKVRTGVRVGVGLYTEKTFYLTLPVGVYHFINLKNHQSFLEIGAGVTWACIDGKVFGKETNVNGDHFTSFVPSLGFRKQFNESWLWKIAFTPVINKDGFVPWAGLSVGKSF